MIDLASYDPTDPELQKLQKRFLHFLLKGDSSSCLELARDLGKETSDVLRLYIGILQPSMYTVGQLWEADRISVAQEHLASAIVSRVIAATYVETMAPREQSKGKVLISCGPGELHEIGSWMVSDLLELEGWQVRYLGGNTSFPALLEAVSEEQPDIVGLSVTMDFNVGRVAEVMEAVRQQDRLHKTRFLLGGRACFLNEQVCGELAPSGRAADGLGAIELVRKWESEGLAGAQ